MNEATVSRLCGLAATAALMLEFEARCHRDNGNPKKAEPNESLAKNLRQTIDGINATLSDSATDLLAALRAIVNDAVECEMDEGTVMVDGVTWDLIVAAKAALARATG